MISPRQLRTLQTLFGLHLRSLCSLCSSLNPVSGDDRSARLAWASENLGRPLASFNDLDAKEAARLIGLLKQTLGQESKLAWRRPRDRQSAMAAGTHGRKGRAIEVQPRLPTWKKLTRCGSTSDGRTNSSRAGSPRARWALKAMLKRAG